jgi:hypothetical protein
MMNGGNEVIFPGFCVPPDIPALTAFFRIFSCPVFLPAYAGVKHRKRSEAGGMEEEIGSLQSGGKQNLPNPATAEG